MALTFTPSAELGSPLVNFELPQVTGGLFSTKSLPMGKPVLIIFMCNHCPYVKAIENRLIQLGHDLKKMQIPMIGICSNDPSDYPEDSLDELKKRFIEKKYSFDYLHDENQSVAKLLGAVCTPDFFVYNNNHQLAYRGRLDDSWKDETKVTQRELYQAILALSQGEAAPDDQVSSMGCSIKWKE